MLLYICAHLSTSCEEREVVESTASIVPCRACSVESETPPTPRQLTGFRRGDKLALSANEFRDAAAAEGLDLLVCVRRAA